MKIKEKLLGLKDIVKKVFEKYPISMLIIFVYTIFYTIIMDTDFDNDLLEKITIFGCLFAICVFFAENIIEKINIKRIVLYVFGAAAALFYTFYLTQKDVDFDYIVKIGCCIFASFGLSSLYLLIKKSEKSLPEYLLKVGVNCFKVGIVYLILAIGILILFEIFSFLIYDLDEINLARLELLLFGFYFIPRTLYAFIDLKEEVNNFFKLLVKYVLMILLISAFVIVYLYIVKVLFMNSLPKNQIFRILAWLFALGLPIWTCMQYFEEDNAIYKISLKLPLAFIPFIILQIYTIGIRIADYGWTPYRYSGVLYLILEILYIVMYIVKKEKISCLIFAVDIMFIIAVLIPGINIIDFTNNSQIKIMEKYRNEDSLSKEDKQRIYGAYKYLKYTDGGKEYLESYSKKEIKTIEEYYKEQSNYDRVGDEYEYYTFNYNGYVDIKGYSKIANIYNGNSYGSDCDLDEVKICSTDVQDLNNISIDIEDVVRNYMDVYEMDEKFKADEYFEKHNEFEISNSEKVVITNMTINYNVTDDEITYINIKGYYLKK